MKFKEIKLTFSKFIFSKLCRINYGTGHGPTDCSAGRCQPHNQARSATFMHHLPIGRDVRKDFMLI